MKITHIAGSPRAEGNSMTIAKHFLNKAKDLGADISSYELNKLDYRGCQACMACKTELGECALKDDLADVLVEVQKTDVLVISSAIYAFNITSLIQAFYERMSLFFDASYKSRLSPGKKSVMILTQGMPDENISNAVYQTFAGMTQLHSFSENYLINACGVHTKEQVLARTDILQQTEEIAEKIMKS